jgi:putative tryptophan/tyrosine transport system substrate-binding protein
VTSRRTFLAGAVALLAAPLTAAAQPAGKVYQIGILSPSPANAGRVEAIRQGLRALGYVEGRNVAIESLYAKTEADLPALAAKLVRLGVDVIVTGGSASIRPTMQVTTTIPIVMVADNADPVDAGYVTSYARPGGNVTGLTGLSPDVTAKRMELLKEAVPGMSRVAVLRNPASPDRQTLWSETAAAARALGLQLQALDLTNPDQLESLFEAAVGDRAHGIIVIRDPLTNTLRPQIIALAAQHRLPAMYASREFVDAGGLMVYASNVFDLYRRTAAYVDKILKGVKPSELPVERADQLELVINLKTAKALGLTIPPAVLARADEVIE